MILLYTLLATYFSTSFSIEFSSKFRSINLVFDIVCICIYLNTTESGPEDGNILQIKM